MGLVDLNIFHPTDKVSFTGAQKWNPKGYFSVAGHGNGEIITSLLPENRIVYTAEDLAQVIKNHPRWSKQPVILGACNTGGEFDYNEGVSFAQRLADALGVQVTAPGNLVWYSSDGLVGVGNWSPLLPMLDSTLGDWRIFSPRQRKSK